MAVVERESLTHVQPIERAVFVTDDDRRARRMRRGAFGATAIACLWLIGLGVGMFGFGSLPGVSLINPGHDEKQRPETPLAQQAGGREVARQGRLAGARGRLAAQARSASRVARASASQRSAWAAQRSTRVTPPAAAPPAQQPLNPAQRQRGWARKGLLAPPGQLRTQAPPPPTSRGQRRGHQTTTTTTTTPLPPGQAKKTPPPPPPPA